jgi:hypothetical protein
MLAQVLSGLAESKPHVAEFERFWESSLVLELAPDRTRQLIMSLRSPNNKGCIAAQRSGASNYSIG